jgi:hypothetical protein
MYSGPVNTIERQQRSVRPRITPSLTTQGMWASWKRDKADEITVSARFGRVDLEALKRPRLGGKEPSDDDYRLRFTHALPVDSGSRGDLQNLYHGEHGGTEDTGSSSSSLLLICAPAP